MIGTIGRTQRKCSSLLQLSADRDTHVSCPNRRFMFKFRSSQASLMLRGNTDGKANGEGAAVLRRRFDPNPRTCPRSSCGMGRSGRKAAGNAAANAADGCRPKPTRRRPKPPKVAPESLVWARARAEAHSARATRRSHRHSADGRPGRAETRKPTEETPRCCQSNANSSPQDGVRSLKVAA